MSLEIYENNGGKVSMKDGFVQHLGDYYLHADGGHLDIGHDVFIGKWTMIVCNEYVRIGNGAIIAEKTTLRDANHEYRGKESWIKHQPYNSKPVIISDGCWIGCNCVINAGSIMEEGSVLAGGSVLTGKTIPAFEIWAGNPAKFLKNRFEGID